MLRFVVALEAEARPLAAHFRLTWDAGPTAFKIFRRDDTALVVSGVGKVAAAAAAAFLFAESGGEKDAAWLNVGIAGSRSLAVGEAVLAHRIVDRASGRAWYPPRVFPSGGLADRVTTVEAVERDFRESGCFEMEASGFYPTACRFASAELVHCLKIVSDGGRVQAESLTPRRVEALIEGSLCAVDGLARECGRLSRELRQVGADPSGYQECLEGWRFTVSERRQLRRLLRRRRALVPDEPLPLGGLTPGARGKEVNRRLRDWLDALPVTL